MAKKKAQLQLAGKEKSDLDQNVHILEESNTKLRHELAGLLRENEKLGIYFNSLLYCNRLVQSH